MATIVTANIDFESTSNNSISFSGQAVTIKAGGATVATVNTTAVDFKIPINTTSPVDVLASGGASTNTITFSSNADLTVTGSVIYNGTYTTNVLNSSTSSWNANLTTTSIVNLSGNTLTNTAITIYGMVAGANGQLVVLNNRGVKTVYLEPESSSEATAANRFSFANTITLSGYQSLTVYYDGVSSRWKPIDEIEQYQFDSLLYKDKRLMGGLSGGATPALANTINNIIFPIEGITTTNLGLQTARSFAGASGDCVKTMIAGGLTPTTTTVVCRSRNTSTWSYVSSAVLTQSRGGLAATGDRFKGFFSGGFSTTAPTTTLRATAERITYATESVAAVPGADLSQARQYLAASGDMLKGFFLGGESPTIVATADRTTYATEATAAVPGANLTQARSALAATGSSCKGFFSGGATPTLVATTERLTYATETTAAVPGANLSLARNGLGATGTNSRGYFSGGASPVVSAVTDRNTYSTETNAAVPGANLTQARTGVAGS